MRRWMRRVAISGVLLLGLLWACHRAVPQSWPGVKEEIRQRFPEVPQVQVDDLHAWLEEASAEGARPAPLLLDVRRPEEYEVSHLPGAQRLDPALRQPNLGPQVAKDQPIVVYCSVGYRSSRMAQRLRRQGYTAVSNLEGSIFEWANRGLPLERNGESTSKVHPYNAWWGQWLDDAYHADPQ